MNKVPETPVLVEVAEYIMEGSLGAYPGTSDEMYVHVMWRLVQPGTPVFFWTGNLDWIPDTKARYWYGTKGFQLSSELEA